MAPAVLALGVDRATLQDQRPLGTCEPCRQDRYLNKIILLLWKKEGERCQQGERQSSPWAGGCRRAANMDSQCRCASDQLHERRQATLALEAPDFFIL